MIIDRQRISTALMHPVTVAALVTLIVNDLLFKALWPGSWATGKLSDLAWMVFAPPLLAFLLSLAAPRKPAWGRAVFALAYVCLPLLYLAYNTFEPLHDAIMGVFMLGNRGSIGSPFDPTDSLVIPVAVAIALWVWRYGGTTLAVRRELADQGKFLVAGLACFAMVATSEAPPNEGITSVGIKEDETTTVARSGSFGDTNQYRYVSHDGGWEWEDSESQAAINWGSQTVTTPRGSFRVDGLKILHSADGQTWNESYSLENLDTEGNSWVFGKVGQKFNEDSPSLFPHNLVYHAPSDKVIVAWGLQGALVNTPYGEWHRVAVDRYSPVDFSFVGKSRLLLSDAGFLFTMLPLALAALALALAAAPIHRGEGGRLIKYLGLIALFVIGLVALGIIFRGLVASIPFYVPFSFVGLTSLLPLVLLGATIWLSIKPIEHWWRKVFAIFCGIVSLAGATAACWFFGSSGSALLDLELVFGIGAMFIALPAVLVSWRYFKHWQVIVPALIGINLLILLSFFWWLHLGMILVVAKFAAIIFSLLAAIALATYLKRKDRGKDAAAPPSAPLENAAAPFSS